MKWSLSQGTEVGFCPLASEKLRFGPIAQEALSLQQHVSEAGERFFSPQALIDCSHGQDLVTSPRDILSQKTQLSHT